MSEVFDFNGMEHILLKVSRGHQPACNCLLCKASRDYVSERPRKTRGHATSAPAEMQARPIPKQCKHGSRPDLCKHAECRR